MISNAVKISVGLLTLTAIQVHGHGSMVHPISRRDQFGRAFPYSFGNEQGSSAQSEPIWLLDGGNGQPGIRPSTGYGTGSIPYDNDSFRCRGFNRDDSVARQVLRAGERFDIDLYFGANHPGDCFLYLARPDENGETNMDSPRYWFKIAEFPGCNPSGQNVQPDLGTVTIPWTVPEGIPECSNCVLRFEWYALHVYTQIEFYATCADVDVVNSMGTGTFDSGDVVSIEGFTHLPTQAEGYRNYFLEIGDPVSKLSGPKLATMTLIENNGDVDNEIFDDATDEGASNESNANEDSSSNDEDPSSSNQDSSSLKTYTNNYGLDYTPYVDYGVEGICCYSENNLGAITLENCQEIHPMKGLCCWQGVADCGGCGGIWLQFELEQKEEEITLPTTNPTLPENDYIDLVSYADAGVGGICCWSQNVETIESCRAAQLMQGEYCWKNEADCSSCTGQWIPFY